MSASSYMRYQASTLSGADRIPSHWQQDPLKRFYVVKLGKMVTSLDEADVRATRPYLRSANVQDGYLQLDEVKRMWFSDTEATDLSLLGGDLVVCEGGDAGRSAVLPYDLIGYGFQNSVNRVRSIDPERASTGYLGYWLKHLKQNGYIEVLCNRSTIAHLTADKLSAIRMPCPPTEEQQAIAAFLDRETSKIDALVAEQERLLALLAEKRQAVISRAVTQGLDPSVPMKDSGVEWLGRVPAHWSVTPVRSLARKQPYSFVDGDWIETPYITDDGVRLIQTGNVGVGKYKEQGSRFISDDTFAELRCTEVAPGDLLICRLAAPVGRACVAPDLGVRVITSVDVAILKPNEYNCSHYYAALFSSVQYLGYVDGECRGGTRDRISRSFLGSIRVCSPPKFEQDAIVTQLGLETTRLDDLAEEAQHAVELLKERRAALISAAVTGKIDVRGLVPLAEPAREAA